jgi:hypothetical protein
VQQNCNNGKDRIPTIEDVPNLEYTEKVFRESMRLYQNPEVLSFC